MTANDLRGAGLSALFGSDEFHARHLGPSASQEAAMLDALGVSSRGELIAQTVPATILRDAPLALPDPVSEASALAELRRLAVAADTSDALIVLFRPQQAAQAASPAALRLALAPAGNALDVRILKCRGPRSEGSLRLCLDRPVHALDRPASAASRARDAIACPA